MGGGREVTITLYVETPRDYHLLYLRSFCLTSTLAMFTRRKEVLHGILLLCSRNVFGSDVPLIPSNPTEKISIIPGENIISTAILFDLNVDPNEQFRIQTDPIGSDYSDIYSNLLTRSEYWSSFVKTGESADTIHKKSTWKAAAGISSWLEETTFTPPTIPVKYNSSDQPNIVFVLVDDWVSGVCSSS